MILNLLSITLLLLTIVAFTISIAAFVSEIELGMAVTLLSIVIIGALGWGLVGHAIPAQSISREFLALVIKTPSSLIITKDNIPVLTLTDVYHYTCLSNLQPVVVIESGITDIYYNTNWSKNYQIKQ